MSDAVLIGELAYDAAGVSCGEGVRWDVAYYNASGADYAAVAYGDAGADGDAGAEPAVVADFNGFGVA